MHFHWDVSSSVHGLSGSMYQHWDCKTESTWHGPAGSMYLHWDWDWEAGRTFTEWDSFWHMTICIFTYTVIVILRLRLGVRMYITEKESLAAWPVWQHTFTGVSDTEIERQDVPSLRGKCFCMACLASRNLCRSPRSLSFLISSRWLLYKYGFLEIWKQAQQ